MPVAGVLDQRQRIPGVHQHPGGRASAAREQPHEQRHQREIVEHHPGLEGAHRRRHRGHQGEARLRERRVDGGELGVIHGREDARIAQACQRRVERALAVGIPARQDHASLPRVAIEVVRERGRPRQEHGARHQGDREHGGRGTRPGRDPPQAPQRRRVAQEGGGVERLDGAQRREPVGTARHERDQRHQARPGEPERERHLASRTRARGGLRVRRARVGAHRRVPREQAASSTSSLRAGASAAR